MEPPDHAPVGTMWMWFTGWIELVMSTTSATALSTESATMVALSEPNVNVPPWAVTPAMSHDYATRNVAFPLMRSPTLPPTLADMHVALPLKDIGPVIASDPETPAASTVLEM